MADFPLRKPHLARLVICDARRNLRDNACGESRMQGCCREAAAFGSAAYITQVYFYAESAFISRINSHQKGAAAKRRRLLHSDGHCVAPIGAFSSTLSPFSSHGDLRPPAETSARSPEENQACQGAAASRRPSHLRLHNPWGICGIRFPHLHQPHRKGAAASRRRLIHSAGRCAAFISPPFP